MVKTIGIIVSTVFLIFSSAFADVERLSETSTGEQANWDSDFPSTSDDGRFVAFASRATNLVENDTNSVVDIFVKDRVSKTVERISVSSQGQQADDLSSSPVISGDGRFVAFSSIATNLVSDDTNAHVPFYGQDVFVHDRETGITKRVNVSSSGAEANRDSRVADISKDGRFIAFVSQASNLVDNDANFHDDVFIHDLETAVTQRVSVSSSGQEGNFQSSDAVLNADGRFVAFTSRANNLIPGDVNVSYMDDVFIHDRQTGATEIVSVSSDGIQANHQSYVSSISENGRYVAFTTHSSNLVFNDTTAGNRGRDIYVRDRLLGITERVNLSSNGEEANDISRPVSSQLSADGRFVTFTSRASNLIKNDNNSHTEIFVHDRVSGTTDLSVTGLNDEQVNSSAFSPRITADGKKIAFFSNASNLVTNDTNRDRDVFITQNVLSDLTTDLTAKLRVTSGIANVNEYIRFRVGLANNTAQTMTNCKAELINNPVIASLGRRLFQYYTLPLNVANPAVNKPVDIGAGQVEQMNLVILARDNYRGEIEFRYSCDGVRAYTLPFFNTAHLTAKTDPFIAADPVQLNTNGRDELVIDRNDGKYWTPFVTQVKNPGTESAVITLTSESVLVPGLLRQPHFCEPVDWSTGDWSCLAPRAEQIQVALAPGETKKIRAFTHANKTITSKAVSHRIYIEAQDETGDAVAKTSLAVSSTD